LKRSKRRKTIAELSSKYWVHANQIRQWRKKLLNDLPGLFSDGRTRTDKENEELISKLYRQIGQLKVELDWHKKI
jgi:transposase-like protein